jgi:hypothetical protein
MHAVPVITGRKEPVPALIGKLDKECTDAESPEEAENMGEDPGH